MRNFILAIFMLACMAAKADIVGTVCNTKGKPQKNVRVELKVADKKAKTDKEGAFKFEYIAAPDTLVVYKDNYTLAIIPIESNADLQITLDKKEFAISDGEASVSIPYLKKKRPHRNPNVITYEDIHARNPKDLYDLLAGRVPGLEVSGGQMCIRGKNSLILDTEPLFVIDGRKVHGSAAANGMVNIYDIETIEVDKEGFEYGVEGACGVIKITTRRGPSPSSE